MPLPNIPFRSYDSLRPVADDFLRQHDVYDEIPVPIELVVDRNMGIQIVPIPRLKERIGADATVSNSMERILVDWDAYMDERFRCRCNFSIAHEVAHLLLHREYFLWLRSQISSKEDYLTANNNIPEDLEKRIEFQANDLAGLILVPTHHLRPAYEQMCKEAIQKGIDPRDSWNMAIEYMASELARPFEVSADMMRTRLWKEGDAKSDWLCGAALKRV